MKNIFEKIKKLEKTRQLDVYFYVAFEYSLQMFIFKGRLDNEAMFPTNLEIFPIFPNLLRS